MAMIIIVHVSHNQFSAMKYQSTSLTINDCVHYRKSLSNLPNLFKQAQQPNCTLTVKAVFHNIPIPTS